MELNNGHNDVSLLHYIFSSTFVFTVATQDNDNQINFVSKHYKLF
jgi:hypothetical protein